MTFLIPLKNRGESKSSLDNVLWNEGKVFIMDNHRLALWCWFQKMQKAKRYNLFHIDAHPDMSESALPYFNHDMWSMGLKDYRETWQNDINMPLFRWDNYIEVFLKHYPQLVGKTVSATHHLGSSKELSEEIKPYDLVKFTHGVFSGEKYVNELGWIVNLDLDYFFSAAPEKLPLFSDDYIKQLVHSINEGLSNGMIEVLTISLSPECCGSWENAELMLSKFGFKL
ncbi:hypothetical protein C0V70_01570 [Bacteriovorax stolpii]|uniref:Uncharacterized protein n=2 Tax=Bacteriovorax stolpii TaxID=960 RepID=A0A2K9NMU7_BACTC|nr:UPF0489 family protein [Bacteriovorax stolpii]AUN96812.1 hypothetical protein C0V70_01570 [Bacteriovorax stolpii]TDP53090.1 uncharacterized protein UPF0489 [Bacteriovorax stolpii]